MDYKKFVRPFSLVLVGLIFLFLDQALGLAGMGGFIPSWGTGLGAGLLVVGAFMQLVRTKKQ